MRSKLSIAAALLMALATGGVHVARAQVESTTARPFGGRGGRVGQRGARGRAGTPDGARRQALAKQVRQAFAGVVKRQLNLSDDQARQLQTVDNRFQRQRTDLLRSERQTRMALAAALADTTGTPDQARIAEYMDQLVQAQHKRADLLDAEQKELSGFLTPLQRARYQALRDQLQRRVAELRQQKPGKQAAEPPPPQP